MGTFPSRPVSSTKRGLPCVDDGGDGVMLNFRNSYAIPRAGAHLIALTAYGVLACVFFWPLLRDIQSHILSYDNVDMPDGCDSFEFVWRYWWILAVVRYGLHPLHCDWVWPPTGDNLVFHSHPWVSEVLTLPLGLLFGPVAGYNLMVLLMPIGAAWAYYVVLHRGFGVHGGVAWFVGAAFGFSGYLVLRAHWHVNMIGACFWAPALGILIVAYCQDRLTLPRGIAFAFFFWATFWNSFVEVFMLGIVVATAAVLFEIGRLATRTFSLRRSLLFFLPVVCGGVSLLLLRSGPPLDAIQMPLVDTSGFGDFFRFPRLSVLAPIATPERAPNWGVGLSMVLLLCAVFGVVAEVRRRTLPTIIVLALFAATLVLAADPWHAASYVVRQLPLGQGFRLFTRFTPFVVYFLGILAAWGGDWLWRRADRASLPDAHGIRWQAVVVVVLGCMLLLEIYPAGLRTRPLRMPNIPEAVQAQLRAGGFTLVVPQGPAFIQADDTYQVALDAPCALLTFWDKMDKEAKVQREAAYPHVYPAANTYPLRPKVEAPEILPELEALDIRYVLFADKRQLDRSVIRGEVVVETDREILVRVVTEPAMAADPPEG